jgi:hypothetical protein
MDSWRFWKCGQKRGNCRNRLMDSKKMWACLGQKTRSWCEGGGRIQSALISIIIPSDGGRGQISNSLTCGLSVGRDGGGRKNDGRAPEERHSSSIIDCRHTSQGESMEPAIGPINQFVSHRSHYDAAISVSDRGQGKGPTASHAFCGLGRFQWADQVDANDYSMDQGGIQQDCNSGIIQRARERERPWPAVWGQTRQAEAAGRRRRRKRLKWQEESGRI